MLVEDLDQIRPGHGSRIQVVQLPARSMAPPSQTYGPVSKRDFNQKVAYLLARCAGCENDKTGRRKRRFRGNRRLRLLHPPPEAQLSGAIVRTRVLLDSAAKLG